MKILYAIQGTGNGHVSRARDIIPALQKKHTVDILISGSQADVELPYPIAYTCKGLGFIFGKSGGIDIVETFKKNSLKTFFAEINELPVENYDLVINDFEPVSAWACFQKNIPCIALSHQAAVLNKNVPQPKKLDPMGKAILKRYAPSTVRYGFHFKAYDANIFTPVIRQQIRQQPIKNKGHYTVYLPAYDDKRILKVLRKCKGTEWQVFSKHNKKPYKEKNISIEPISNEAFVKSMSTSAGVLCGAGFETPAEALFMKKKLLVIPMKGQYEQHCNAAALKEMDVPVLKSFKLKHIEKIKSWVEKSSVIPVEYPDNTEEIINKVIAENSGAINNGTLQIGKKAYSAKKFRSMVLKSIATQL